MIAILRSHLLLTIAFTVFLTSAVDASADSISDYHHLTLAELQALQMEGKDTTAFRLALMRKLGQSNDTASLEMLAGIEQEALLLDERLIVMSFGCQLNVKMGLMEIAKPYCDETEQRLDNSALAPVTLALAHNSLGYYSVRQGKFEDALDQFDRAARVPDLQDLIVVVTIEHNRGVALMLAGFTDLAIQAFESASENSHHLASDEPLPTILAYNLGYVQAQAGNHEEALRKYAVAIPWLESTGQLTRQYIASTEISLSLIGLERYQEALSELNRWVDRSDVSVSGDTKAQFHMAKGRALVGLGRSGEAEQELLAGLEIAEAGENPNRLKELSLAYAALLIENLAPDRAIEYLERFLATVDENNLLLEVGPTHELLAKAYALAGNFEKAYGHIGLADDALREAMDVDFSRRLASLSISNELHLKEQELFVVREREKAAESARRLSQVTQLGIFGFLLVLAVITALVIRHRSRVREALLHKDAAARLTEEVRIRTAEVEQALQAQLSAEKDRADLEVRLANDEKLRLIGQLTGGVAHDFNNLLTVIQLSAELLADDLPDSSRKLADDIMAAAESGKGITEGLLAYARQQVLQPTRVALKQFFSANRSIFTRAVKDVVHLDFDVPETELYISVDSGQLVSAVMNLILNAKEASDPSARVKVLVESRGQQVAITVEDEGCGMGPAELKNAAEPFYSTKAPSEGSGLGLAMVEGFMNQSGGQLTIESLPALGTRVTLVFDLCDSPEAEPTILAADLKTLNEERILFVEDDEQVRAVGRMALENAGYTVVTANNGEEALEWLESEEFAIDLLISDLVMPGSLSGDQLIARVKQRAPHLPVLLVTGYAAKVSIDSPVLLKPFKLNALLSTARELITTPQTRAAQI